VAVMTASGAYGDIRACAGIVGNADCTIGDPIKEVLEAHLAAGGGRFRGIRNVACYDADADGTIGLQDDVFLCPNNALTSCTA